MADATWTTERVNERFLYHTATINGTDNDTATLKVSPKSKVSYAIDHGGTDTGVGVSVSLAEDPENANMVARASSISADAVANDIGPISGIRFTGASSAAHVVRVLEVLQQ